MKPRRMQLFTKQGASGQLFHCVSRFVGRAFVFTDTEKRVFVSLLRKAEAFSGVKVITWTMLSNHFHLVVHVPEKVDDLSDHEFWRRLRALYTREEVAEIRQTMRMIPVLTPGLAGQQLLRAYRKRFSDRMHDLSAFMKTLLQRFSTWFNRRHDRVGRVWESRFRSLVIEDGWDPLMNVAAYVDLNAVRAGLVTDPKDYPWCGYAEAVAGNQQARRGLGHLLWREAAAQSSRVDWRMVHREYRRILTGLSAQTATTTSDGRVRAFTEGVVIGRRPFVEGFFEAKRDFFGDRRRSGSRKIHGGEWGDLRTIRDLRPRASA